MAALAAGMASERGPAVSVNSSTREPKVAVSSSHWGPAAGLSCANAAGAAASASAPISASAKRRSRGMRRQGDPARRAYLISPFTQVPNGREVRLQVRQYLVALVTKPGTRSARHAEALPAELLPVPVSRALAEAGPHAPAVARRQQVVQLPPVAPGPLELELRLLGPGAQDLVPLPEELHVVVARPANRLPDEERKRRVLAVNPRPLGGKQELRGGRHGGGVARGAGARPGGQGYDGAGAAPVSNPAAGHGGRG